MCLAGGGAVLLACVSSLFSKDDVTRGAIMPVSAPTNIVDTEEVEVILDTRGATAEVQPSTQNVQFGCGPQVF